MEISISEKKEILLNTYMHKLPVSKRLNKRFDPKQSLTLREFIKLNPFLVYETDGFVGYGNDENCYFYKKTLLWEELKKFLLGHGFTSEDWAMLIPDEMINKRKDLSFLNKEQILALPLCVLSSGSSTCNKMFGVTVADLLKEESAHYNKQTISIQNKLRLLGFDDSDGPFMEISRRDPESLRILKGKKITSTRLSFFNYSNLVFL